MFDVQLWYYNNIFAIKQIQQKIEHTTVDEDVVTTSLRQGLAVSFGLLIAAQGLLHC